SQPFRSLAEERDPAEQGSKLHVAPFDDWRTKEAEERDPAEQGSKPQPRGMRGLGPASPRSVIQQNKDRNIDDAVAVASAPLAEERDPAEQGSKHRLETGIGVR